MAEQGGKSPEAIRQSELPKKYQDKYVALDVRFMMTPKATEDGYTDFVDVNNKLKPEDISLESLGVVDSSDIETNMNKREIYDRIGNASTRQRKLENTSGALGSEQFNQDLDKWAKGFHKTLTGKDSDPAKNVQYSDDWNNFFDRYVQQVTGGQVGRDILAQADVLKLYDRYFKGDEKASDPRAFAKDIVRMYRGKDGKIDQEALNQNIEKVQLIARIFGDFGDEAIAHAIKAEVQVFKDHNVLKDKATVVESNGEIAANTYKQPESETGKKVGHTEEEIHRWIVDKGKPLQEFRPTPKPDDPTPDDKKLPKTDDKESTKDSTKRTKKLTDQQVDEINTNHPKQKEGLLPFKDRFVAIDMAKYPPNLGAKNPFVVDNPPEKVELSDAELKELEATVPFFIPVTREINGNTETFMTPNPLVNPHTHILGDGDFAPDGQPGMRDPRFIAAEASTDGDSGIFALAAASAKTPEEQGRLYGAMINTILRVHKNNPQLLRDWLRAQGNVGTDVDSTSAGLFRDYDLKRPDNEQLFKYDQTGEIDIDGTVATWEQELKDLDINQFAQKGIGPVGIRFIECLAHSVNGGKMMEMIKAKSGQTPPAAETKTVPPTEIKTVDTLIEAVGKLQAGDTLKVEFGANTFNDLLPRLIPVLKANFPQAKDLELMGATQTVVNQDTINIAIPLKASGFDFVANIQYRNSPDGLKMLTDTIEVTDAPPFVGGAIKGQLEPGIRAKSIDQLVALVLQDQANIGKTETDPKTKVSNVDIQVTPEGKIALNISGSQEGKPAEQQTAAQEIKTTEALVATIERDIKATTQSTVEVTPDAINPLLPEIAQKIIDQLEQNYRAGVKLVADKPAILAITDAAIATIPLRIGPPAFKGEEGDYLMTIDVTSDPNNPKMELIDAQGQQIKDLDLLILRVALRRAPIIATLTDLIEREINKPKIITDPPVNLSRTSLEMSENKLMMTTMSAIALYPDNRFFSRLTPVDPDQLRFSPYGQEGTAGGTRLQINDRESGLEIYQYQDGGMRIRRLSPRITGRVREIALNGTQMDIGANSGVATKSALAYEIEGKYYKLDSSTQSPTRLVEVTDQTEIQAIKDKIASAPTASR